MRMAVVARQCQPGVSPGRILKDDTAKSSPRWCKGERYAHAISVARVFARQSPCLARRHRIVLEKSCYANCGWRP